MVVTEVASRSDTPLGAQTLGTRDISISTREPNHFGTQIEGIRIAASHSGSPDSIRLVAQDYCGGIDLPGSTVIEDLTASLRDTDRPMDSRASMRRDAWVVRMVRFGAAPVLVAALLNVFQFHEKTGLYWSWALGCAWFNAFLGVSILTSSFVKGFAKKWRPVMFVVLLGLIGSDTVLGTIGHEPKLLFISLILLMVGTGSILPWSIRVQIGFNLLCLAVWVAQGFWVPSLDGMGAYKMLALITAASLSYFTCYLRDRFVREYEESERTILESESSLRQLFDANTDGITLIDVETGRIQDVNEHFLRISGFRRDDVIGKAISELDVWTDPAIAEEFNRRLRADGGSITNMEVSFRVSDGRIVPCLLSCVVILIHGRTVPDDTGARHFRSAPLTGKISSKRGHPAQNFQRDPGLDVDRRDGDRRLS